MASYSSTPSFYSSEFLSSPAPSEGFVFTTDTQTDGLGSSIATGDIDGDGLEDIVLAATTYTKETGEIYVILSSANPTFGALNNLDDMVTAGTAVKIIGDVLQSSTDGVLAAGNNGVAVGDFNGDGLDDLLIGNRTEIASGAHIIFGGNITAGSTISTADLDGSNGFSITRGQAGDQLGASVAAGDFNGDGFDDILIGAPEYDVGGYSSSGAVHIINGGVSLNVIGPDFALSTMDGSEGAKFFGGGQNDTKGLGSHVANVGDVDGDGVDDFGMTSLVGQTTILYGKNPAFNEAGFEIGETPLAGVAVNEGRTVSPFGGTEFLGGIVAAAGDVNGDGFGDFTVSVPREADIVDDNLIGVTHLIFGAPRGFGNLTTPLTDPSLAITFDASNGDGRFQEGFAIGDINGDGFDDWAIMGDASNGARADIIFGGADVSQYPLSFSALDGSDGFVARGGSSESQALAALEDINGDGRADFLLTNGLNQVAAIFGRPINLGEITATGSRADQTIFGGEFDDTLNGLRGDDLLRGFGGDDVLIGSVGDDKLDGADGADDLDGGAGDDVLFGGAGVDQLLGRSGDDTLSGDDGNDRIEGGAGNDTITGGAGIDFILGDSGDDTLSGGDGNDRIEGGDGVDIANGGDGLDIILGDSGDDELFGNDGNDDLRGGDDDDRLSGGFGDDVLDGASGADWAVGQLGEDDVSGGDGNDVLGGGSQDDVLTGGEGDDMLNGGHGADRMTGGDGNDKYSVDNVGDVVIELTGAGTDTLQSALSSFDLATLPDVENLTAIGAAAAATFTGAGNALDNVITGGAGDDVLTGLGGDDVLDGGAGADTMQGGDGNDAYVIDSLLDVADESSGSGVDELRIALSGLQTLTLAAGIENAVVTSGSAIVNGNDGNNAMTSTAGAVVFNGLLGDDTLTGGSANDELNGDEGADIILGGAGEDILNGDAGDDQINGGAGNDLIDGGIGADDMTGGAGDDTFIVDNVGDSVTEGVGGGTDLVNSSVDLILADNVENMVLTGAALIGTGNSLDNTITGTDGNNTLDGLGGDDVLIGLLGDDTYIFDTEDDVAVEAVGGGTDNVQSTATVASLGLNIENLTLLGGADINGGGNDIANIITGNSGANSLLGFGGNDLIDGRLGADFMNGGAGDDTFIVDNVFDLVTENSNQGLDTVQSSVSFNISLNIENLLLVGTALNGSGNFGANLITGNDLGNTITGDAGDDILRGADGDDDLDGGSGADEMEGGAGSDVYRVDNVGDTVIEQPGEQGIDRVAIEFGGGFNLFTLGAGVENADLEIGSGTVRGNAENNNIEVTTGFVIIADGAGGNDQIIGSVNADRLLGGSGDDVLTGGDASDRIFGQAGDDIIRGGEGNDVMAGQSNADRYEFFVFSGLDLITDFDVSEDVIALDIDSIGIPDFSALQFQIQDNGNGNAEIEIAAGTDVITLTGVTTAQLSAANFDFF